MFVFLQPYACFSESPRYSPKVDLSISQSSHKHNKTSLTMKVRELSCLAQNETENNIKGKNVSGLMLSVHQIPDQNMEKPNTQNRIHRYELNTKTEYGCNYQIPKQNAQECTKYQNTIRKYVPDTKTECAGTYQIPKKVRRYVDLPNTKTE